MDIFEYAKNYDADYYDPYTGYIYKVQDYNQRVRFGLPHFGIQVIDSSSGKEIGWVRETE